MVPLYYPRRNVRQEFQAARAASPSPTSEAPPNSMLMPTSTPSAHSAVPGRPAMMIAARTRSTPPLMSMKAQRPDNSRLCSNAYMIEAAPSTMKNAVSTSVSDSAPPRGHTRSISPTAMPSSAETSAQAKPGAPRAMKVVTRPTTPLASSSQPRKMVMPSVASGGTMIASAPSTWSTMPSIGGGGRGARGGRPAAAGGGGRGGGMV